MSMGGKHMINLLKYLYTYRQFHLMDDDRIIRDIFETTSYLSLHFMKDMMIASNRRIRSYDLEYRLPDYHTIYHGTIQIPFVVQQQQQQKELKQKKEQQQKMMQMIMRDEKHDQGKGVDDQEEGHVDEDEDDEDYVEVEEENKGHDDDDDDDEDDDDLILDHDHDDALEHHTNNNKKDKMKKINRDIDEEDINSSSSDEEDDIAIIQKLKREEKERKLQLLHQQQILYISTERFTVPEILFHPYDIDLPNDWCNITQSIIQCISSCPIIYQPALYSSIQLTGGLSKLPNIKQRLYDELKSMISQSYSHLLHINIVTEPSHHTSPMTTTPMTTAAATTTTTMNHDKDYDKMDDPIYQAWYGAVRFTNIVSIEQWSIQRDEWHHYHSGRKNNNRKNTIGNQRKQQQQEQQDDDDDDHQHVWNKLFTTHGGQII
jgi:Actin